MYGPGLWWPTSRQSVLHYMLEDSGVGDLHFACGRRTRSVVGKPIADTLDAFKCAFCLKALKAHPELLEGGLHE